ncbi:fasciclin domain-containing protein [Sphingobacterium sp. SYP-B4668]|uniref:fasciclin domain-containing protein n=1 Tax=Sphingobacterium sp. SYP-B4668 TaxID=2996035 RepID=UPI0022DE71CB|nr:fasciclin domain-containing protein [Sphingobacterium sp. SYP-B4668]
MTILLLSACKKDYYQDGGIHDPKFNGTIMDFLESRPELFDTLVRIVKIAGLEPTLENEEITFFAPPNASIGKTLRSLNRNLYLDGRDTVVELEQIKPSVWKHFLGMYMMRDKYILKDFPQLDTLNMIAFPGQIYLTYNDEPMNVGVIYNDVITTNSEGVKQIVKYAGYRQLHISSMNSFSISGLGVAPVATSDIQPHNGSVHVLQFSKHGFGFNNRDFIDKVYATGVSPRTN